MAVAKNLAPKWQDWEKVTEECVKASMVAATAMALAEKMEPDRV